VTYNRLGRVRAYGRAAWLVQTFVVCLGIRAIHQPVSWLWKQVRRRLDVAALFALAALALPLSRLKSSWNLHPFGRVRTEQPSGPQRLVLFIPSMGMGGAQRQLVSFLTHLDRAKWEPELVTLNVDDKFFEPAVRDLGVPVTYLNPRQDFWMVEIVWRLFRHLMSRPPVVLHSWLHYAVMLGAVAGAWAGVPVVIGSLRSQRPGRFPWFYPKWQRGMDVLTVPLQTALIANSNAVADENRHWAFIPSRKLITVYNGIEFEPAADAGAARIPALREELGLPPGAPVVGIVGRLFPEKDHATFLRAAAVIGQTRPDARFLIVGDGILRGQIEKAIMENGLAGRVLVLGARQDAQDVIRLLDVLVLTSLTEGFPNVLLEAVKAGTSIVTTAAGGASEVVVDGETGFVVPCGDAAAVAARVLDLLRDPGLKSRFVQAGLARGKTLFAAGQAARSMQAGYLAGLDGALGAGRPGRLHVCFIAPYVLGFLRPHTSLPMGGAEVQVGSLARELARDPRLRISLLTEDGDRTGVVQEGDLTLTMSPMFGAGSLASSAERKGAVVIAANSSPSAPMERGRQWVERLPGVLAWPIRKVARTFFSGQRLVNYFTASPRLWLASRWQEGRHCLAWWRLLKTIDADVYVMRCASPQVGYVTALCSLMNRRLVYMVAHEDDVSGAYVREQGIRGRRFAWGLQRADAIVCQHGDQARLLQALIGREGKVIPSLCLPGTGSEIGVVPGSETSRRIILWMARLVEWKQPELLLELARALPDESFVAVAPAHDEAGGDVPAFRQLGAQVPNLRWLTNVPFHDTHMLFAQAKGFVNTSRAEGFPNTFLQAAAAGTPVLSWSVNPEGILDRYQFGICANGDRDKFVQAVRQIATDPSLAARLGENGKRYVQECHDQATIIARYAELFLSLSKDPMPVAGAVAAESPAA
jgi:glycosyltransferase involved in cell wall biosynthesis